MNRTISIVAGGFLGQHLADQLVKQKYKVKVSYRSNEPKRQVNGIEYYRCVVGEGSICFDDGLFDADCLIICIPPGFNRGVANFYPENIKALLTEGQNGGCSQIIFTSSIGIYPESGQFDETTLIEIVKEKQKCLLLAEQAVLSVGLKYKQVLRLAGLIGPGRHPGRFNPKIVPEIACKSVNLVLVQDVVRAMILLVQQPDSPSKTYNLVAPHHPGKQAFYRFAKQTLGRPLPPVVVADHNSIDKRVSGQLIEQELDFHYEYTNLFAALTQACQP